MKIKIVQNISGEVKYLDQCMKHSWSKHAFWRSRVHSENTKTQEYTFSSIFLQLNYLRDKKRFNGKNKDIRMICEIYKLAMKAPWSFLWGCSCFSWQNLSSNKNITRSSTSHQKGVLFFRIFLTINFVKTILTHICPMFPFYTPVKTPINQEIAGIKWEMDSKSLLIRYFRIIRLFFVTYFSTHLLYP